MAAGERQFRVVGGVKLRAQSAGCGGGNDVVVLRIDVQHGHPKVTEIDPASIQFPFISDQFVLLIQVLHPLFRRFARMVGPIRDPLFHAEPVHQPLFIVDDFEQVEIVFQQAAHRRHLVEDRPHEFAGQVAVGVDQTVHVLRGKAARPDIDEAVAKPFLDRVGMKIDRGDGQRKGVDPFGFERHESRGKHPALAHAQQIDLWHVGPSRYLGDATVEVGQDVIIQRQVAVGSRGISPIHDIKVKTQVQQITDQRAIFLQIRHRPSPDEAVTNEHGYGDPLLRQWAKVEKTNLVLPPHQVLWCRRDLHVRIAQACSNRPPVSILVPSLAARTARSPGWFRSGSCLYPPLLGAGRGVRDVTGERPIARAVQAATQPAPAP